MALGDYKFLKVNSGNTFDEVTFLPTSGSIMGFDANLNPINLPSPYAGLTAGAIVKKVANGFADSVLFERGGAIGIGTSNIVGKFHIVAEGGGSTNTQDMYSNNAQGAGLAFRKARGTFASPSAASGSDLIGALIGFMYNGTEWTNVAALRLRADGSNLNGKITFETNNNIRATLKNDGKFGLGTETPAEMLDVVGTVRATGFNADGHAGVDVSGGTLKSVTVRKGIITAATSVTPIADGTYTLANYKYMTVSGGIITALVEDN